MFSVTNQEYAVTIAGIMLTVLVIVVIGVLVDVWNHRKMPPGPWQWPVFGNLPNIYYHGHLEAFRSYREKYGDIYSLKFGFWHAVVISDRDVMKEISSNGTIDDRPMFFTNKCIGGTKMGIVFAKHNKRFIFQKKIALNALKSFTGSRSPTFGDILEEETEKLSQEFLQSDGKPIDPIKSSFFASGTIIFHTVYGKSCDSKDDVDLKYLIENIQDFKNFTKVGDIWDVMPYLFFLAPVKFWKFMRILGKMRDFGVKKIKEHQNSYDHHHIRDVMDALIKASKQYTKEEKAAVGINSAQIIMSVFDFIGAGFDTIASTISWGILYLADNTDIQEKCYEEISRILGNRRPSLLFKPQLPYMEATVLEIIRMSACVPMGIPRASSSYFKVRNYEIPPNTVVILDVLGMSFDPNVWEYPFKFRPERFLHTNGSVNQQMAEKLVSFGIGKRRCLGEAMAKLELFFIFTHFLQNLSFDNPGQPFSHDGEYAFVREPRPFNVIVKSRYSY